MEKIKIISPYKKEASRLISNNIDATHTRAEFLTVLSAYLVKDSFFHKRITMISKHQSVIPPFMLTVFFIVFF